MSAIPQTDSTAAGSAESPVVSQSHGNRRHKPRPAAESSPGPSQAGSGRRPGSPKEGTDVKVDAETVSSTGPGTLPTRRDAEKANRRRRPRKPPDASAVGSDADKRPERTDEKDKKGKRSFRGPSRGRNFNASLSEKAPAATSTGFPPSQTYTLPKKDDLTSTLIHDLSTPPYLDCVICFSAIRPLQPTWSCSPLILTSPSTDAEGSSDNNAPKSAEAAQYCWTTFHLKCIRSWASKSVKDIEEAWRARGENKKGEWRCPGCQAKRMVIPTSYWCFCGSTPDPKPTRLATPHSCAGPCSRGRPCGHPCSLTCHPGPCPPCQVTIQLPCHCGKQTLSFRCSSLAPGRHGPSANLSCGKPCGRPLGCGNHNCERACHDGPCSPCEVQKLAKCYCGQSEKELRCGEGVAKTSTVIEADGEHKWVGMFECDKRCGRPFDCGIHHCERGCHPPSLTPALCPRSPSLVTHCPCGKHSLDISSAPYFPSGTVLTRNSCSDPIPTCESTCMKPLERCSHACAAKCHVGPCPRCTITVVRPCRCGMTTRNVPCYEDQARRRGELGEILCDKPCTALRACGRHQCNRLCCPLASLVHLGKGKGKKKMSAVELEELVDDAHWHECDLVCGKLLGCGNHYCEEKDHRGACPPCLRSSFEEMVCHCGRTILEPPIPCGTRISCSYPCSRPPLPCGHPKSPHACHEDPIPCPPCPYLTTKKCACGKKMVGNVRCSQEKVSCGTVCGKLLSCGFHHCERLCHADNCGACRAVCGKPRKLCLPSHHPCTLPCHAPAACSEAEPCRTPITLTCPCGRIRQQVPCGRSTLNPQGQEGSQQLRCTNECLVAKRNARLAEALGINPAARTNQVTYTDELLNGAKADMKFCFLVEKTFADFVASDKKTQVLPQMPPYRRQFVHDLAEVYRMDTQMVDQEPHRSVQLIRRIDSRIPTPLLSASASSLTTSSSSASLGKLTDLRAPAAQLPRLAGGPGRSQTSTPVPSGTSGGRGWTSVAARPPQAHPSPSHSPTPWVVGDGGARSGAPSGSACTRPLISSTGATAPAAPSVADIPDSWEDDA